MNHPIPPLSAEHREAILALGPNATQADVRRIAREFNERRDREFPGWREAYNRDVEEWANKQGASTW